jgi:hypothetical protein
VLDHVVNGENANKSIPRVDDGHSPYADASHLAHCEPDPVVFVNGQELASYGVADRDLRRLNGLCDHPHYDVPIRNHTDRARSSFVLLCYDEISYVFLAHEDRGSQDGSIGIYRGDIRVAYSSNGHGIDPASFPIPVGVMIADSGSTGRLSTTTLQHLDDPGALTQRCSRN